MRRQPRKWVWFGRCCTSGWNLRPESLALAAQIWDIDCQEVGAGDDYIDSAYNHIPATWLIMDALGYKRDTRTGEFSDSVVTAAIAGVSVITPPQHGRLIERGRAGFGRSFQFSGTSSFQGMDKFSLRVDARDKAGKAVSYLMNYKVAVVAQITNEQLPSACERWLKSTKKSSSSISVDFFAITALGLVSDQQLAETGERGLPPSSELPSPELQKIVSIARRST